MISTGRLRNFYIRFYDDAQEMNQVQINQVDHVQEKAWDVNVSAQFVKLFMPAKSSNCLHLAEFEVFGVEVSNLFDCQIFFSILDTFDFCASILYFGCLSTKLTTSILSSFIVSFRSTGRFILRTNEWMVRKL